MITPYPDGGLNMLEIKSQNKALRIKWVDRILTLYDNNKHDVQYEWLKQQLPVSDVRYFLESNINRNDFNKIVKINNMLFWYNVLLNQFEYTYDNNPVTISEICTHNIWLKG